MVKPLPFLVGTEVEYGLTEFPPQGRDDDGKSKAIPFTGNQTRMDRNGGRIYTDVGSHPEYATPECPSAEHVVAAELAGDRIILDLIEAERVRINEAGELHFPEGSLLLFRNNCDYTPERNAYGYHENLLVPRETDFAKLTNFLFTHMATREIYTGSGFWDYQANRFEISPRAGSITTEMSDSHTRKGLINSRDEPHSDGSVYRRVHIVGGSSNVAQVSTYLKVGVTQLLTHMFIDGGLEHFTHRLLTPIGAIKLVSKDLTAKTERLKLKTGKDRTALSIQSELCDRAHGYLARGRGTPEQHEIAGLWGDVLDRLKRVDSDPSVLDRHLDWVIEREFLRMDEERRPRMRKKQRNARNAQYDMMYHVIGDRSIHAAIARSRCVEIIVTEEEIADLVDNPPHGTRANVRGRLIRHLTESDGYKLTGTSWVTVGFEDERTSRKHSVDLNDPYCAKLQDLEPEEIIEMIKAGELPKTEETKQLQSGDEGPYGLGSSIGSVGGLRFRRNIGRNVPP